MDEDMDQMMKMIDAIADLNCITQDLSSASQSANNNISMLIDLGKYIANLEHQVEQLEEENLYLKMMIKDHYGGNT